MRPTGNAGRKCGPHPGPESFPRTPAVRFQPPPGRVHRRLRCPGSGSSWTPCIQTIRPSSSRTGQLARAEPVTCIRSSTSFTFRALPEWRSRTRSPGFHARRTGVGRPPERLRSGQNEIRTRTPHSGASTSPGTSIDIEPPRPLPRSLPASRRSSRSSRWVRSPGSPASSHFCPALPDSARFRSASVPSKSSAVPSRCRSETQNPALQSHRQARPAGRLRSPAPLPPPVPRRAPAVREESSVRPRGPLPLPTTPLPPAPVPPSAPDARASRGSSPPAAGSSSCRIRLRVNVSCRLDESSRHPWPSAPRYASISARRRRQQRAQNPALGKPHHGVDPGKPLGPCPAQELRQHRFRLVVAACGPWPPRRPFPTPSARETTHSAAAAQLPRWSRRPCPPPDRPGLPPPYPPAPRETAAPAAAARSRQKSRSAIRLRPAQAVMQMGHVQHQPQFAGALGERSQQSHRIGAAGEPHRQPHPRLQQRGVDGQRGSSVRRALRR